MYKLPESLFAHLTKLKSLELVLCCDLNKNHFNGLVNLQSLNINSATLNEELDIFVNLKELTLYCVTMKQFSFEGLETLEYLKLVELRLMLDSPLFKFKQNAFKDLTKLKILKVLYFKQPLETLNKEHKLFFQKMFHSIPTSVEQFNTNICFLQFLSLKPIAAPFIDKITKLDIGLLDEEKKNIEDLCLFQGNLFRNLESLILQCYSGTLAIQSLKKMRNLKVFKTSGLILKGVDNTFNYLTDASFSTQLPENISNFVGLQKHALQGFSSKITLDEDFLKDLVNLEELRLQGVFKSIDENAQYLFKTLTKLKILSLLHNGIKILKSSYLDYLVNLEDLDLAANGITKIEVGSFKNLTKLKMLHLGFCRGLEEIEKDTFVSNKSLERIYF